MKLKTITTILCLSISSILLYSCIGVSAKDEDNSNNSSDYIIENDEFPIEPLSEERENEIKQIYIDMLSNSDLFPSNYFEIDNVAFSYFGKYNGYEAVNIHYKKLVVPSVLHFVRVEDYTFTFSTVATEIKIFDGQSFYPLDKAYERELITIDDVRSLHELTMGSSNN